MMRSIDPSSHQPKVSQTKQLNAAARPKKEGEQASDTVEISSKDPSIDLKIQLNEKIMELDEFVVTATKTPKRKNKE